MRIAKFRNKAMSIDPEIVARLRCQGMRMTRPRQVVLDALRESGAHLNLEQVYQAARRRLPTVSLATIYRNLDALCELRLAVAADVGGGRWVYEIAGQRPHHHLVCRTCGAISQIDQEEVETFLNYIQSHYRFQIDMDHMALFGLCASCQSTQTKEEG